MVITIVHILIYLIVLISALTYLGRNIIRSLISGILNNDTNKIIVSFVLVASLVFFIDTTFKHFFWDNTVIGLLILSDPPYDRVILLPMLVVFPLITAVEIWNKTKNTADALLAWILAIWIFTLISFPEPSKFYLL